MTMFDRAIRAVAGGQRGLVTRRQVLAAGGTDSMIKARLDGGLWVMVHPGVYLVGAAPLDWHGRLLAGVLSVPRGLASRRAGLVLWGADGLRSAPLEMTVPHHTRGAPVGVIVHRTRYFDSAVSVAHGVPVTSIERTLLEVGAEVPDVTVEKAYESALRLRLTSETKVKALLAERHVRWMPGYLRLKRIVLDRPDGRPAGSGGEVELLRQLRIHGVEPPIRQYEIELPDGTVAVVDLAWPLHLLAVEFDGGESRAGIRRVDYDDTRQNAILDAGWRLRRYGTLSVRRRPAQVALEIKRALGAFAAA